MEAGAKRVEVGRVIGETFSIYGAQAGVLLGTAVVVFVVAGVIQGLLAVAGGLVLGLISAAVNIIAVTLYSGFVVKLVEDVRDGKRDFTVGELLGAATGVLGALVLNSILRGIAIAIGFFLLVVPGLILLTIWAVTAPAIVIERAGAIDAFGRSRELVRGQGWPVFGTIVVAFLITLAIGIVTGAIGAALGDAGRVILSTVGAIIAAPIAALVSAVLFFDLGGGRAAPEGAAPPEPAEPTEPPEPAEPTERPEPAEPTAPTAPTEPPEPTQPPEPREPPGPRA